jgi:hypothetical protein
MPGAGGLTASNWFEDLAKPDGLTLYYCVGSTAVTQQAFGLEGVKYNLRSWEMLGSVDRATSWYCCGQTRWSGLPPKTSRRSASARAQGTTPGAPSFSGVPSISTGTCVGFWLSRRRRAAARLRAWRDRPYATANLLNLRELMAAGFRPFTQQGSLTSSGSFRRRPEFKDVPTFDEMLGKRRPTGDAWAAYVTWLRCSRPTAVCTAQNAACAGAAVA